MERRPVHLYSDAAALAYKEVKSNLAAIDRSQPVGKRDYALLSVALQTGRRLSELASLRRSNLKFDGAIITIHWHRTKGGKTMSDRLPQPLSRALAEWLSSYYALDHSRTQKRVSRNFSGKVFYLPQLSQ